MAVIVPGLAVGVAAGRVGAAAVAVGTSGQRQSGQGPWMRPRVQDGSSSGWFGCVV